MWMGIRSEKKGEENDRRLKMIEEIEMKEWGKIREIKKGKSRIMKDNE